MSDEQRQLYLARRRANYQERIRRGHETHDNEAGPSNRRDESGASNRLANNITDRNNMMPPPISRTILINEHTSDSGTSSDLNGQNVSYTSSIRRGTNQNTVPANNMRGTNMNDMSRVSFGSVSNLSKLTYNVGMAYNMVF
ncbi:hypothetical protein PIB30_050058 [Stylosanthes scabra]|uniref:Uncharacterized protein n=1 Tax=Stylosanthes scabra TaxID=79078 RepID=A0ABU6SI71_9FABA|nr:hypothetical protein [Stylosanthes scabra]